AGGLSTGLEYRDAELRPVVSGVGWRLAAITFVLRLWNVGHLSSKTPLSIVVAFITFFPVGTKAQSPRDYLNIPVNQALLQFDFLNTNTETASASDVSLPNNLAVSRLGVATLLWSFPLADRYGGVAVTGGYIKVKGTRCFGQYKAWGLPHPGITFHANIFGAPALRRNQFAQAIQQSYMSIPLTVNAQIGSYDRNS